MAEVLSHQTSGGGEACLLTLKVSLRRGIYLRSQMRGVICADSDISHRSSAKAKPYKVGNNLNVLQDVTLYFEERHDVGERSKDKRFVRTYVVHPSELPRQPPRRTEKKIVSTGTCSRGCTTALLP